MTRLIDPKFTPRPDQIALLQAAVRRDLDGTSGGPTKQERTRTSGEIGEAAVLSLLQPLAGPDHSVVDANTLRKNHPGFDFLIDDQLRIQVKCSTYVECLQTSFGAAIQTGSAGQWPRNPHREPRSADEMSNRKSRAATGVTQVLPRLHPETASDREEEVEVREDVHDILGH